MDLRNALLVLPVHLAETRAEALNDLCMGAGRFNREYLGETLGQPLEFDGPVEQVLEHLVATGEWIVGTPDDCIETIKRLDERSGGFGGFLVGFTQDLAPRDKVLRSYELIALCDAPFPGLPGRLARVQSVGPDPRRDDTGGDGPSCRPGQAGVPGTPRWGALRRRGGHTHGFSATRTFS